MTKGRRRTGKVMHVRQEHVFTNSQSPTFILGINKPKRMRPGSKTYGQDKDMKLHGTDFTIRLA